MQDQYQPYARSSSNYTPFNYMYYYCWKFGKQFHMSKSLKIVYHVDCVDALKKKYTTVFESTVTYKGKKGVATVPTYWVFEGEETLILVERTKLINANVADEEMNYDEDFYSDYSRDVHSTTVSITVLYRTAQQLKDALKHFEPVEEKNKNNIFLITGNHSEGFYLRDFTVKLPESDLDLELNYGKDFAKKHEAIVSRLNCVNDTGLVVLNGKPGTGKTTYIKYLTTLIDKKVIFVPPAMAEGVTAPNFLPFLLDNKNSILVIEDAEKVVGSRESADTNNGVSNILNMTDGILGDCLNIQVIATMNVPRERIDVALLRKGRLIAEHEFKELPEDNVKRIFKKLKVTKDKYEPMILTDIYNHEEDSAAQKESEKKFIGFK